MRLIRPHGGTLVNREVTGIKRETLIEASAEMRTFASYLTKADPSYPSWEYTYIGDVLWAPVMHPRFKQKIARYYEQWKQFKAQRGSVSVSRRL